LKRKNRIVVQKLLFIFLVTLSCQIYAQKTEKIDVPKRVVYKYCKPKIYEDTKKVVITELSDQREYLLVDKILFVGPVLWTRFGKIDEFAKIEGGNMTLLVDNKQLLGKMTQNLDDSKKIWDKVREEVKGEEFKLRKATYAELDYYWTVISWDIEEPLIIIETSKHRYILNINAKTMKLLWLDEAP
jgi:hypothetical protein